MGDLAPGTKVGGYTIERLVGRGGFGAVYLAQDRRLGRKVALKILDEGPVADERARARFLDESRKAASLDHPNIVPIYEAGASAGRQFLAMRYVPGPDLGEQIEREGRLPPERAARIVLQVASALDAAHGAGLVHRDVKPGNVLLATGSDGIDHAYLTDFGLSKRVGGTGGASATMTGRFVGTVGYVAPEQIKGRPVDARADTYSLGCLAFHVLTGQAPFARDSEIDTLMAHVDAPPPSVHDGLPELADRVDPVIARAMSKDPAARHATAGSFATELAAAIAPRSAAGAVTRGFLFADLRGYTAFIEANGDAAAVGLLDAYRKLVREVIARHMGAEIKTEGDSFYVVFPSASSAVEAGLSIVAGAEALTAERPERPIRVGVGIHAGESTETAEGYVGSAVNIAARACAVAQPGEVLITDTVRSLIRTSLRADIASRGRKQLKGISEPMAMFAVSRPVAAVGAGSDGADPATGGGGDGKSRSRMGALVAPGPRGPRGWAIAAVGAMVIVLVAVGGLLLASGFLGGGPVASPSSITGQNEGVDRLLFTRERDDSRQDGGCIAVDFGGDESRPYAVAPNGTEVRELPLDGDLWTAAPAVSPSGAPLAFWGTLLRVAGLFTWSPEDDAPRQLTGFGMFPSNDVRQARWSPDGTRLAWMEPLALDGAMVDPSLEGSLNVLDLTSGSTRTAFAAVGLDDEGATPSAGGAPGFRGVSDRIRAVDWLPDGTLVVGTASGIWALDRDLAPRTKLGTVEGREIVSLAVAPDGTRVAVAASVPQDDGASLGAPDLFVMDTAAGTIRQLTDDPAVDSHPTWSPDGSELAFASDRSGRSAIYAISSDGDTTRSITRPPAGFHDCWPDWGKVPEASMTALGPTPSPESGATRAPLEFRRGRLEPGAYRSTDFQPNLQITTATPWVVYYNVADAIRGDHRPTDEERWELQVLRLATAMDPVCGATSDDGKPPALLGTEARDVIDWLESRPELTTHGAIPRVVDGHPALEIRFEMRDGLTSTEICGAEQFPNGLTLFPSGGDLVVLRDGQEAIVWVIDVGGEIVTVMGSGNADDFGFRAQNEIFGPIISSLRFDSSGEGDPTTGPGGSAASGQSPGSSATPPASPMAAPGATPVDPAESPASSAVPARTWPPSACAGAPPAWLDPGQTLAPTSTAPAGSPRLDGILTAAGPLEAGRHRSSRLTPPVSFEIGPGWTAGAEWPHYLPLSNATVPGRAVDLATVIGVIDPAAGPRELAPIDLRALPDEAHDCLLEALLAHPFVRIERGPAVQAFGNQRGWSVDVRLEVPADASVAGEPWLPVFMMTAEPGPSDRLALPVGSTVRIAGLQLADEEVAPFLLVVAAAEDDAGFEAFAPFAQQLIDTVQVDASSVPFDASPFGPGG